MTKTSCQGCRQLTNARVKRELTGAPLPPVLAINTAVHTPENVEVWLDKQTPQGPQCFLQPRIAISETGDRVIPINKTTSTEASTLSVYELRALVVQIQADDDPAHLVSLVKGSYLKLYTRMIEADHVCSGRLESSKYWLACLQRFSCQSHYGG
jgi:PAB-dependent poly(A)-specific ribonuclease subunit 2